MKIRPRVVNEPLQGKIIQELLTELQTLTSLAHNAIEDIMSVRAEIIALHHLGVIRSLGERTDTPRLGRTIYDRDTLWGLTDHGMNHSTTHPGCTACNFREKILRQHGDTAWAR